MSVLVTGGAGYIGSIVTEHLFKQGHSVIVLDNLKQGHREAVLSPAELVSGGYLRLSDARADFPKL